MMLYDKDKKHCEILDVLLNDGMCRKDEVNNGMCLVRKSKD